MSKDKSIIQAAMSEVDRESSLLSREIAAFKEFRESVRLVAPEDPTDTASSGVAENLREAYTHKVMDGCEYDVVYADTLSESLEEELSPGIADILMSEEPVTQRRKRSLLLETAGAIERREQFNLDLDEERKALEIFSDNIVDLQSSINSLPRCLPQKQTIEKVLRIWDSYDNLEKECDRLLKHRQEQIRGNDRFAKIAGEQHALNSYLYQDLETVYPLLNALGKTIEHIKLKRRGDISPESLKDPMSHGTLVQR